MPTRVRRQVYKLTPEDLNKFPVWEYATGEEGKAGQDEATVRPVKTSGALDTAESGFIVRAAFVLADGTQMIGFLNTPFQGDDSLGRLQPVIATDQGQIFFWYGMMKPDARILEQRYKWLGRKSKAVFPVQVESDVRLKDGPVRTTIPGFMAMKDFKTKKIIVIK